MCTYPNGRRKIFVVCFWISVNAIIAEPASGQLLDTVKAETICKDSISLNAALKYTLAVYDANTGKLLTDARIQVNGYRNDFSWPGNSYMGTENLLISCKGYESQIVTSSDWLFDAPGSILPIYLKPGYILIELERHSSVTCAYNWPFQDISRGIYSRELITRLCIR